MQSHIQQARPEEAAPAAPIDACSLITSEEIEAVQGEPLKETKPAQRAERGLAISECFFTLPTFANSISLSVAQKGGGPDARDAREFWQETFGDAATKESEKSGPPRKMEGVGDDAFWTGDDRMGALYVLTGSRYLRISAGGPGDQAAKIKKCQALAEMVLKRL